MCLVTLVVKVIVFEWATAKLRIKFLCDKVHLKFKSALIRKIGPNNESFGDIAKSVLTALQLDLYQRRGPMLVSMSQVGHVGDNNYASGWTQIPTASHSWNILFLYHLEQTSGSKGSIFNLLTLLLISILVLSPLAAWGTHSGFSIWLQNFGGGSCALAEQCVDATYGYRVFGT